MDKCQILQHLNMEAFYKKFVPSLKSKSNGQAMGLCPFHDDKTPSFSLNKETGLFRCFTCDASGDMFTFYQKLKNVDFKTALKNLGEMAGVKENKLKPVATFQYTDEKGNLLYIKERIEPGRNGRKKEFIFKHMEKGKLVTSRGCEAVPYNLPELAPAEYAVIVEGEAKVELLKRWRVVATCLDSGAQSPWKDEYMKFFDKKRLVIIMPDNDDAGRSYAARLAKIIHGKVRTLKVLELPGLETGGDIIDWANMEGNHKIKWQEILEVTPEWTPKNEAEKIDPKQDEWDMPILFDEIDTPEIPASLLPAWLCNYARDLAIATETPEALSVFTALGVLSAAVSKRFAVVPKPGWKEPVNIYVLIALPPANNKTKVLNACTAPIIEWEVEQAKILKPNIKRKTSERKTLEGRIDFLRKKATTAGNFQKGKELQDEIYNLEENLPEIPVLPKIFVNDTTPESLISQVSEHGGRFAIIGDEGGIFEVISGLYSSGAANVDIILKGIDGGHTRVRRKDKSYDLNPYLSFAMSVQPVVVQNMATKKSFTGNGMRERFLYVLPKSRLGYRTHMTKPVSDEVEQAFFNGIKSLLDIPPQVNEAGEEIPRILTLDALAHKEWRVFQDNIEMELRPDGKLYPLLGWGGKICGYTLRIAALLHIAEVGLKSFEIKQETMNKAIEISTRLIDHAIAAFNLTGTDQITEDAKHILQWIKKKGEPTFNRRKCQADLRGRFQKIDRLNKALDLLVERNIISEPVKTGTNGRPSIIYNVNPFIFNDL